MWWMAYIHPRDSGGVLWQLYQPRPGTSMNGTSGEAGEIGFRRLDHISLASPNLESQAAWQERVFGMEMEERWEVPDQGYKGCLMRIPNSEIKLEILEPLGDEGFLQTFLARRGRASTTFPARSNPSTTRSRSSRRKASSRPAESAVSAGSATSSSRRATPMGSSSSSSRNLRTEPLSLLL